MSIRASMLLRFDCVGEMLLPGSLRWMEACISRVRGTDDLRRSFWVTRTDIYYWLQANGFEASQMFNLDDRRLQHERFHTPTVDLYLDATDLDPVGQLFNFKMPLTNF